MNFSFSIPLATIFVLFLTLVINIFSLRHSIEKHFPIFIQETLKEEAEFAKINPNWLSAVASIQNLENEAQKDYQSALTELDNISTSLQNLSENPKLYIWKEWVSELNEKSFYISFNEENFGAFIDQTNNNLISAFLNPFAFPRNWAETKFIYAVFKNFLIINLAWFTIIALFYILWIRKIFKPIKKITENIHNFSYQKNHEPIIYNKKNEFRFLVDEINNSYNSIKEQERIRNQFLSDLSHEIRTPITAISGILEAINDWILEVNSLNISLLQSEIIRLTKITEAIMDHEKFLSKNELNQKIQINLKSETQKIIEQYNPKIQNNNQKIINNFDEKNFICADSEQYIQLLHNIFSNFCKYSGKNTILNCDFKETKNEKILIFSDNGVGVKNENLHKIKEKFFREDNSRTQNIDELSMWIGLSIIEKIMILHNGNLIIEPNSPNWLIVKLIFNK